jgi:hypothetical protein
MEPHGQANTVAARGDGANGAVERWRVLRAVYAIELPLNPEYAFSFNNRGMAWRDTGDLDHAVADFGEAIRLNPSNGVAAGLPFALLGGQSPTMETPSPNRAAKDGRGPFPAGS